MMCWQQHRRAAGEREMFTRNLQVVRMVPT
jgi:hypothetical protein